MNPNQYIQNVITTVNQQKKIAHKLSSADPQVCQKPKAAKPAAICIQGCVAGSRIVGWAESASMPLTFTRGCIFAKNLRAFGNWPRIYSTRPEPWAGKYWIQMWRSRNLRRPYLPIEVVIWSMLSLLPHNSNSTECKIMISIHGNVIGWQYLGWNVTFPSQAPLPASVCAGIERVGSILPSRSSPYTTSSGSSRSSMSRMRSPSWRYQIQLPSSSQHHYYIYMLHLWKASSNELLNCYNINLKSSLDAIFQSKCLSWNLSWLLFN